MLASFSQLAGAQPGLRFIENKNQWPADVHFAASVPGGRVFIKPDQFTITLLEEQATHHHVDEQPTAISESNGKHISENRPVNGHSVQINFIGADESVRPEPFGTVKTYYNFFLGNSQATWAPRAAAYNGVLYPGIYEGIDLKISSVGQHLKYDFIVTPGADPSRLLLQYCGADALALESGNLVIKTSVGTVIEKKPYTYQLINNKKVEVTSRYRLTEDVLWFEFPNGYDSCYELVIDPLLIFSTFSGSTADNWGSTATPGENGTLYSSGIMRGALGGTFPATPGAFQTFYAGGYDVALLKYDSTGSQLLYASYLGGSSNETPHSMVMDSNGDLLMFGTTSSLNFPVTAGVVSPSFNGGFFVFSDVIEQYPNGSDMFVARISPAGDQLKACTYLGGSLNDGLNTWPSGPLTRNYGDEMRGDIITDGQGNVYISSVTSSANFPIVNGFSPVYNGGGTDAVLVKLNSALTQIEWSTFIGGNGHDAAYTIKFDSLGNIYTGGGTTSANFPITPGAYQATYAGNADGWMALVNATGTTLLHSTFTGTNQYDQIYFLDVGTTGDVYVYGQTTGPMPVTPRVYKNPNSGQFVQKLSGDLSTLVFSTVFGSGIGIPNISPTAFLVSECNNLYMSGWGGAVNISRGYWPATSRTTGMPVTPDALQSTTFGSDFYFIVLTEDASELLYATFLGGPQTATHVDGGTSRFDKSGIVYHAVCAGCGGSFDDFPTTPGAWSNTNNSLSCNNAAFKFDLASLRARLQTNKVDFSMPGIAELCYPDTLRLENFSTGGEIFEWDLGDGTKLTKTDKESFLHQYQQEGAYLIKLKAIDLNTCTAVDSVQKLIMYYKNDGTAQDDTTICQYTNYQLDASGGVQYQWISKDSTFQSNLQRPFINPEDTTLYIVTITDAEGCVKKDTVQINVVPGIDLKMQYEFITNCFSRPAIRLTNNTNQQPGETYFFDFGDGFTSDQPTANHAYDFDGFYGVKLVGVKETCVYEQVVTVPIFTLKVPNVITPEDTPGDNDTFFVQYGEALQSPADFDIPVRLKVFNRWGRKVYESNDYRNTWAAKDLDSGIYFYEVKVGDYATCKSWVHVIK
ncbi:MAG: gliding motility-associated C-terminal domain-containing protein [Flammeovirgaceae bacterium]|nr:MAG: gliding motility-associated C-terminal domain-containing protein [Flammeovirgaceae bacterium]